MESIKTLTQSRQSTIDNRQSNKLKQSTIDYQLNKLQTKLNDTGLGKGLVAKALNNLGEAEVMNIADYALRKGNHPGKLFVSICKKAIEAKNA